ncbi:hypothetical protein NUU61_002017 [Penicillium alfredii]|uniref:Disease resistance protein Aig2 n=1 Tax=Penicillium alfredii TaxID=1506179 RepID=A0A9W9KFL5_9EURO|nr:uncharacterized protein NUU61_002017 [Penicillium alfredii]KAJ5104670.1 hypothetical protein NUU61_002017 [Penicillium alfredii]
MGDHVLFFYGKPTLPLIPLSTSLPYYGTSNKLINNNNTLPGTLMAPQMLHRVIHGSANPEPWQKALIRIQPAVLHGYRRHRVRGADYPAIVAARDHTSNSNSNPSSTMFSASLDQAQARTSVRGTLVSGLTDGDMYRLDLFEGDEYVRELVSVRLLQDHDASSAPVLSSASASTGSGDHLRDVLDVVGAESAEEGDEVAAIAYVWVAGTEQLEEAEWDFETFKREKLERWIGADESEW